MRYELQNIDFCGRDTPWCYFASAPLNTVDSFAHYFDYWHPIEDQQVIVRVIQGRHCETPQSLFREWSAALQFPYYSQIDLVLPEFPDDFAIFIGALKQAHEDWKIPNRESMNEPTAPFTTIFHSGIEKSEMMRSRLRATGADPEELQFSDEFLKSTTDRT
jgi:hypothetical protein